MSEKIKVIFMGTPEFSVPYLKSLIDSDIFEIAAVITQPDKPKGRKQIIEPSPVKVLAQKNDIEILQPEKLKKNQEVIDRLKATSPDLLVVVAYGQIIPKSILEIAKLGNVNVHPSLLPKYRGASPIQNAILNNEAKTGLTILLIDEEMDHGPILDKKKIILDGTETNESLHQKLSGKFGTEFFIDTLKKFINQEIKPQEQNHSQATYCQLIEKDEARINWQEPAKNISAKIRAFFPWPVAWTMLGGQRVKIFPPIEITAKPAKPGKIFLENKKLAVGCQNGSLIIDQLQIEGKNKVNTKDFIIGNKDITSKFFE